MNCSTLSRHNFSSPDFVALAHSQKRHWVTATVSPIFQAVLCGAFREGFSQRKEALTFFELQMFSIVHLLTWCAKKGFEIFESLDRIPSRLVHKMHPTRLLHKMRISSIHLYICVWYAHISKTKRHEKNILIPLEKISFRTPGKGTSIKVPQPKKYLEDPIDWKYRYTLENQHVR